MSGGIPDFGGIGNSGVCSGVANTTKICSSVARFGCNDRWKASTLLRRRLEALFIVENGRAVRLKQGKAC